MLDIVIIVKVVSKCVSAPMEKIVRVATRQHLVRLTPLKLTRSSRRTTPSLVDIEDPALRGSPLWFAVPGRDFRIDVCGIWL
jgi:hypothetical protein